MFAGGTVTAYGTTNSSVSDAAIDAALGADFDVTELNRYSLVATPTTATTGTYDVLINGTEVIFDVPYSLGPGGSNGEINWEEIHPGSGSGIFDDLLLFTIPEPSALTLTALGLLAYGRRRKC
jgi:hypothetical protein